MQVVSKGQAYKCSAIIVVCNKLHINYNKLNKEITYKIFYVKILSSTYVHFINMYTYVFLMQCSYNNISFKTT